MTIMNLRNCRFSVINSKAAARSRLDMSSPNRLEEFHMKKILISTECARLRPF